MLREYINSNAIIFVDQRFEVKNSIKYILSDLDIQLEQLENDNPECKLSVQGCEI